MRVNFDIVGSSVDKSRAIYLNFLHVFRFNIESLVHAPWRRARFSRRGLETLIEDRWGRVREIFEIIYRRTRRSEETVDTHQHTNDCLEFLALHQGSASPPSLLFPFGLVPFFRHIVFPLICTRRIIFNPPIDRINVVQIIYSIVSFDVKNNKGKLARP